MKRTEIRATDIIIPLCESMVRPHTMYFVLYSSSLKGYYVARKDAKKTIKSSAELKIKVTANL